MVVASVLVARGGTTSAHILIRRYLAALVLIAVGMSGSAVVGSIPAAALTFAGTGAAYSLLVVTETQLILLWVPSSVQGRLFGARDTFNATSLLLGLIGAGALVSAVGVRITLAAGAGICAVCALASAVTMLRREPRRPSADDAAVAAVNARTGFVRSLS
jgi:MFS family permease